MRAGLTALLSIALGLPAVGALSSATAGPSILELGPPRQAAPADADPDSLLVRFQPGTRQAGERAIQRLGLHQGTPGMAAGFVEVQTRGKDLEDASRALRSDPAVADVQPNWLVHADSDYVFPPYRLPNDPLYAGSGGVDQQYLASDSDFPRAWAVNRGAPGIPIAIIDTGVDRSHADLNGRVLPGYDFANGDADPADDNGHGTMVAGIAAAKTNNGVGIAGAAWRADIIPVKVLDANGDGTLAEVARGIVWAAQHGARVMNISLGTTIDAPALRDAVNYALAADIVVVASAGNDGASRPHYPAAYPGVIAVGATTLQTEGELVRPRADFSNYGPWVDLVAPGVNVIGTFPQDQYARGSGTSFSAPIVAGLAVMVRAKYPSWPGPTVVGRLERRTDDFYAPPGRDDHYGHGSVHAYGAVGGFAQVNAGSGSAPLDAMEPDDTIDRAVPLVLGAVSSATLAPDGDVDWYRFDASAAGYYQVTAAGSGDHIVQFQGLDPIVDVYGPDRRALGEAEALGQNTWGAPVTVHAAAPATYFVRVINRSGAQTPGHYTVKAEAMSGPGVTRSSFEPLQREVGFGTYGGVTVADVSSDARPDVLVASLFNGLSVWRQRQGGGLSPPYHLKSHEQGASRESLSVGTGRFDGDGALDVVVATTQGVDFYVQRDRRLVGPFLWALPAPVREVKVADVDLDGDDDVLAAVEDLPGETGPYSGGIYLMKSESGSFVTSRIDTRVGTNLQVAEMTGDGRPDIVLSIRGRTFPHKPTLRVLVQDIAGRYRRRDSVIPPELNNGPSDMTVADVTNDGRADVVMVAGGSPPSASIYVMAQLGDGFASATRHPTKSNPSAVEASDFNRDGRMDLAIACGGFGLEVNLQQPDGTFSEIQYYQDDFTTSRFEPNQLAVGDVTDDGLVDIVAAGLLIMAKSPVFVPFGSTPSVRDASPPANQLDVAVTTVPTIRFGPDVDPASLTPETVRLLDARTGTPVPTSWTYDAASRRVTLRSATLLTQWAPYAIDVGPDVRGVDGNPLPDVTNPHFLIGGSAVRPGAPTNVTALAANGTATVRWDAPAPNDSAPVVYYTVQAVPAGPVETVAGTVTVATVRGLIVGWPTSFRVTALSMPGPSPISSPSANVVP